MAELVQEPRAPGPQASMPQTARFKVNPRVSKLWKRGVVSDPQSSTRPLALQGSDKFCSGEKYFTFPLVFPTLD